MMLRIGKQRIEDYREMVSSLRTMIKLYSEATKVAEKRLDAIEEILSGLVVSQRVMPRNKRTR